MSANNISTATLRPTLTKAVDATIDAARMTYASKVISLNSMGLRGILQPSAHTGADQGRPYLGASFLLTRLFENQVRRN